MKTWMALTVLSGMLAVASTGCSLLTGIQPERETPEDLDPDGGVIIPPRDAGPDPKSQLWNGRCINANGDEVDGVEFNPSTDCPCANDAGIPMIAEACPTEA